MCEYLLQRLDQKDLLIPRAEFADVLTPRSQPCAPAPGWGEYRLAGAGWTLAFSFESPGLQLLFEGDIAPDDADRLAAEIAGRLGVRLRAVVDVLLLQ